MQPRRLFLFSLIWLVCGAWINGARGQVASLSGSVRDALTGEALVGATIYLVGTEIQTGAAADAAGVFHLVDLPPGQYAVTISYVGYDRQTLEEFALNPGERRTLDVALYPAALQLNPLTVSASLGAAQSLLDAPSAISVLDAQELESRSVLTAADHLKGVSGVDLITSGIAQSRVVIRGFNDNLASSLLTLVDHRLAQVPSIRLTALQLIPIGGFDIDRIEVVSGPASALYGPNSANGVLHVLTKSPFESKGTSVGVGMGENSVRSAGFSHAATLGNKIGYRFSGQYIEGRDFESTDPVEVQAREEALIVGADPDTLKIGARNFDVRNLALSSRIDYRFHPLGTATFQGGLTQGTDIELSPTGAVQVKNAQIGYLQARLSYRTLFAQVYLNALETGDSFILRTGLPFEEHSRQWVAQLQNSTALGSRETLSYGLDAFLTRPNSAGTVSGRFEGRDDINEFGAYIQSETALTPRLTLVAAGRLDQNNRIDHLTVSPRLAAVYRPGPTSALRLTFNRAYQTPAADALFSDVLGLNDVFQGYRLEPLLGFAPVFDLRAQGSADGGFHFRRSAEGATLFRSPYAILDPRGRTANDRIELNDPVFTDVMWGVARELAAFGLPQALADAGLLSSVQVLPLSLALSNVLPRSLDGVDQILQKLDLETQTFVPVTDVTDFEALDITQYQTLELGYQGIVGRRLLLGIDLYRTRVANFIGPYQVATPNVFLDPVSLRPALEAELKAALARPENALARSLLNVLDRNPAIGNRNGTAADEVATLVGDGLASAIPFGTVSPDEAFEPYAVILARRNFGDISLMGIETRFTFFVTRALSLTGTYAFVNRNLFENVEGVDDISLNAPKHKFSGTLRYSRSNGQQEAEIRARRVGRFPVRSDVYIGAVDEYTVLDVSATIAMPFSRGTRLTATVQNVLNNAHREFVNVPEIGRLGLLRITHAF